MPHTNTYVYWISDYHAYVSILKKLIMHQKLINCTNFDKELLVFNTLLNDQQVLSKIKKLPFIIAKATLSQQISNFEPTYVTNVKMYKGLLTEAKEFCISCRALAIWLARVPRAEPPWDTEETIRKKSHVEKCAFINIVNVWDIMCTALLYQNFKTLYNQWTAWQHQT